MEVLVKTRDLEIKVQDTEGYQVCTTCRGAKELWKQIYHNPNARLNGEVMYVNRPYTCMKCSGKGFWKVAK